MIDHYDISDNGSDGLMWLLRHFATADNASLQANDLQWPPSVSHSAGWTRAYACLLCQSALLHHKQLNDDRFKFKCENTYFAVPSSISWSTYTLVVVTLVLCHTSWVVRTGIAGTRSLFTPERKIMSLQSRFDSMFFNNFDQVLF